jgi:hypothetical protein
MDQLEELLDEYLERWLNIKGYNLDIDAYVSILNFIEFVKQDFRKFMEKENCDGY